MGSCGKFNELSAVTLLKTIRMDQTSLKVNLVVFLQVSLVSSSDFGSLFGTTSRPFFNLPTLPPKPESFKERPDLNEYLQTCHYHATTISFNNDEYDIYDLYGGIIYGDIININDDVEETSESSECATATAKDDDQFFKDSSAHSKTTASLIENGKKQVDEFLNKMENRVSPALLIPDAELVRTIFEEANNITDLAVCQAYEKTQDKLAAKGKLELEREEVEKLIIKSEDEVEAAKVALMNEENNFDEKQLEFRKKMIDLELKILGQEIAQEEKERFKTAFKKLKGVFSEFGQAIDAQISEENGEASNKGKDISEALGDIVEQTGNAIKEEELNFARKLKRFAENELITASEYYNLARDLYYQAQQTACERNQTLLYFDDQHSILNAEFELATDLSTKMATFEKKLKTASTPIIDLFKKAKFTQGRVEFYASMGRFAKLDTFINQVESIATEMTTIVEDALFHFQNFF